MGDREMGDGGVTTMMPSSPMKPDPFSKRHIHSRPSYQPKERERFAPAGVVEPEPQMT